MATLQQQLDKIRRDAISDLKGFLKWHDNHKGLTELEIFKGKLQGLKHDIKHNSGTWDTGAVSERNVRENIIREVTQELLDRLIEDRVNKRFLEGWK